MILIKVLRPLLREPEALEGAAELRSRSTSEDHARGVPRALAHPEHLARGVLGGARRAGPAGAEPGHDNNNSHDY